MTNLMNLKQTSITICFLDQRSRSCKFPVCQLYPKSWTI